MPTTDSEPQSLPRSSRSRAAMQQRRDQILVAAIDLFQERGYLGATTDEIADSAGVTKRTLYRHMGSKQHLLLEIHENFIAEGLQRWRSVVDQGGSPGEVLENLVREHLRTVASHQKAIRVFFEEIKHLDEADRRQILAERDEYEAILHRVLREGMRSGTFRQLDARVTAKLILGTLTEIYRWYSPDGPLSIDQIADLVVATITDGLRA